MVDDAVDEAHSPEEAHSNIVDIEHKLHTQNPSELSLFKHVVEKCNIPMHAIKALMKGCEADLHSVVVQDVEELAHYCYLVAGSVGEMMSPLLKVTDP